MSARVIRFAPRVGWGLLVLAVVAVQLGWAPASAYRGAPWFEPGQPYDQNFPDPAILEVDGTYYAYSTTTGGASLPVMTSTDLVTWIARGDALGTGPSWSPLNGAGKTNVWAPTVARLPDGTFMAAFAARTGAGDRRCIATAHAGSALGPFISTGSEPFVCEPDPNGALDPFLVVDTAGVPWLVWKNEGVPVGWPGLPSRRTAFWSRQLDDDGRAWRAGSSVHFLLETTELARPWQGTVIENPALIAFEESWLLVYSANRWNSAAYAMGFARCASPGGPCVEPGTQPLAVSDAERLGPGAPAPFLDPGGHLHIGYHGWNPPYTNYPTLPGCDTDGDGECADRGQRFLFTDRACITGGLGFLFDDDGRSFCDVPHAAFHHEAVDWLAGVGVTSGITPTTYGSGDRISRAQMATFLWRLMGEPSASSPGPFVDVPAGAYFADAVAWLVEDGVTTGVSADRFDPSGVVSRAQMAAFLWRLMGSTAVETATPFADVPSTSWFGPSVRWLTDRAVTSGTSPTMFSPHDPVTRAQMAVFLCRLTRTTDYGSSGAPTTPC